MRTVERLMAAGDAVSGYVHQLRQAPKPVTLKDLQVIAKIGDAPRRYGVIEALAAGRAKSAAEAVVQLKGARPPRDAAQASLEALLKTWDRAPMAAKRSFLDEVEPEVRRILGYMGAS